MNVRNKIYAHEEKSAQKVTINAHIAAGSHWSDRVHLWGKLDKQTAPSTLRQKTECARKELHICLKHFYDYDTAWFRPSLVLIKTWISPCFDLG